MNRINSLFLNRSNYRSSFNFI